MGPLNLLTVRIGRWFEARATGWGVAALPLVILIVLAAAGAAMLAR